jgi:hypothetical protein
MALFIFCRLFLRHYAFNFIRIYVQNGAAQILAMYTTAFPGRSYKLIPYSGVIFSEKLK